MPEGLFANPLHWAVLVVVVLIIFGPGKLPGVGSALGKSLREFKRASNEEGQRANTDDSVVATDAARSTSSVTAAGETCARCGHGNVAEVVFCGKCGSSLAGLVSVDAAKPEPASAGPALCDACQTENPAGNRFCAHCGRLIDQVMNRV
jgi:sec-independent protein translocase protein TatA